MKIEITRDVKQTETIEIEFPYYYKHDLLLDNVDMVIYGKVEENKHTSIQVCKSYCNSDISFELEIENRLAKTLSCYMNDAHKSSVDEYMDAKAKLLTAAQDA